MAIYKIQGENPEVFNGEHFSRRVRVEYACDYTPAEIKELLPEMVHRFKVMDDDGVTYFWGITWTPATAYGGRKPRRRRKRFSATIR